MTDFITKHEAIIIFLAVIILWSIGYFYVSRLDITKDKKYELSIRNLAALSVFLVIYNIYVSIKSNNNIERNRLTYNTIQNIQRNWLDPQQDLLAHFPEGYLLYASMTQDADFKIPEHLQYNDLKREQLEVYTSLRIFQAMEDFLSSGKYDETGNYVWTNNFLMWMQSPILQHYWTKLSFNYANDTRVFVERVIVKSNELNAIRKTKGSLSAEDYDKISRDFKVNFRD